ncbi:MAG: ribokinase [Oscillospiraceae bacterium]|jgi:ribokinase|nr:ribokinase [Oscillospiraceae bacterium]
MKLLVFGSLNIDDVYLVDHLVKEGETIDSRSYTRCEGGKGLNQAIALAKAGAEVYFAGAVGEDGAFLPAFLSSFGVRTEYIKTVDEPTGRAIIQVDDAGRNSIILYGGANRRISPETVDDVLCGFGEGDCILLQNEISSLDYLICAAHEKGMTIFLNPSPITEGLKRGPLGFVDWFILNEVEGYGLTGHTDEDGIIMELLRNYPSCRVLLTLGEKGSVYADAARRARRSAFPVDASDTTAAGDTFTGYFVNAILNSEEVDRALLIAAQAAAIAVSRFGAGRSIPYADEVERALTA